MDKKNSTALPQPANRAVTKKILSDSNDDLSYWLSQPADARLKAVEQLRVQYSLLVQMKLTQDFQNIIQLLNSAGAEYIIAGGFAVALYGYPRYTGDIDIWINPSHENAFKVLSILYQLGYDPQDVNLEDLTTENVVVQLGYPPNRIDLSTGMTGLSFESSWQNKIMMPFGGTTANFISLDDLKRNKQATARQQDLLDLENLPK
ncbi:hypothetical protein [uncultured Pontibacter sp.]|uniref:nucleotidyltransferase domain-containing protein n=1 Tax=uncultured Pontibacter sp. TaxID=453356 RepID=UPI0026243037|nr:hypothetical protein [uncultured Pontibacter sp.]